MILQHTFWINDPEFLLIPKHAASSTLSNCRRFFFIWSNFFTLSWIRIALFGLRSFRYQLLLFLCSDAHFFSQLERYLAFALSVIKFLLICADIAKRMLVVLFALDMMLFKIPWLGNLDFWIWKLWTMIRSFAKIVHFLPPKSVGTQPSLLRLSHLCSGWYSDGVW